MDRSSADRFLGRLGGTAARKLREAGMRAEFRRGDLLLRAGDGGAVVHLIVAGCVKVTSVSESGVEVILDFGRPGDLYGEIAMLTGEPRIANVVALERTVTRRIDAEEFRSLCRYHPDVREVTWLMSMRRLAATNTLRMAASSDEVIVLVARRLLHLVETCGERVADGWRVDLPVTKGELAQYVPTSESSLARVLQDLRRRGLVRTGYMRTVVIDPDRLRSEVVDAAG